jgi:sulfide dehydrogenase cytochrome subunit
MCKPLIASALALLIALVRSPPAVADAEMLSLNCNGCHGPKGVSQGESIPSIAGLDVRYFMRTMLRYRKGERRSTIMGRISQGYSITQLRQISEYFSALEWGSAAKDIDARLEEKGREIHEEICEECHEQQGRYQDKDIPRISGQTPYYLYLQLLDYRGGVSAMPQPEKMKERLKGLGDEDLEALSLFYAGGD